MDPGRAGGRGVERASSPSRTPANNNLLTSVNAVCLQSLGSAPCTSIDGTGTVDVYVEVSYTSEGSATPSLDAYSLDW